MVLPLPAAARRRHAAQKQSWIPEKMASMAGLTPEMQKKILQKTTEVREWLDKNVGKEASRVGLTPEMRNKILQKTIEIHEWMDKNIYSYGPYFGAVISSLFFALQFHKK
jgi:hypothetical protein